MELRQEDIAEIMRIFNDSDLVELRLELGGNRLYLSKAAGGVARWDETPSPATVAPGVAPAPDAPAPDAPAPDAPAPDAPAPAAPQPAAGPAPAPAADNLVELKSPLLGVFYRRPAPDKPPFVDIGSEVELDDPVCIIDVMKMFSRVPAGIAGRVVEILAEEGQLVEHGQVLMRLEAR